MIKNSSSNAGGVSLILGWGAKILHALWTKNQNRSNIVTNSIKTLKEWSIPKQSFLKNKELL